MTIQTQPAKSSGVASAVIAIAVFGAAIGGIMYFDGALPRQQSTPLTCDLIASEIVENFQDRMIHPVRIMDIEFVSRDENKMVCAGNAWLNTGAEVKAHFELRFTPDGSFMFFQPVF